jgi:hypothetical protein
MTADASLRDAVESYLGRLRAGDIDGAFHGLTDLGPRVIQPLIAAYRTERSPQTSRRPAAHLQKSHCRPAIAGRGAACTRGRLGAALDEPSRWRLRKRFA